MDVVIVTTIDYNREDPLVAMKRFEPFLERHYHGKWAQQDRSFGIEMSYVDIDLVVTALPAEPATRAAMESLYRSQAVQLDESLEESSDWAYGPVNAKCSVITHSHAAQGFGAGGVG